MPSINSILRRGISRTLLLASVRRRYPGRAVDSVLVEPGAKLGEHVRVAHDVEIRSNVTVGRWTYIEPYSFVNGADIGSFCAIGRNVAIGCFQHPYTYPAVSAKLYRDLLGLRYDDPSRPVVIGSDVWIGEGTIVLGGGSVTARSSGLGPWSPATSSRTRSWREFRPDESVSGSTMRG